MKHQNRVEKHGLIIIGLIVIGSVTESYTQVNFTKHVIDDQYNGVCSVFATDLNGDSLIDVLGAAWDANTIAWWQNNGDNPITWTKHIITRNFRGASYVYATDVDSDGDIDILGTAWDDNEIAWWCNDGGNPISWTKQTIDTNFGNAHEVYATDMDGDGDMDVFGAAAGANEIAWWENNGTNPIVWTKRVVDGNFDGARSVFATDIDSDGDIDVIGAAFLANDITLWSRNSDSSWTKQIIDDSFSGAHKVYACDIDGDGDIDILGAGYYADDIAWWRNDGGFPIQWTKQTIDANFNGALAVYANDVDGDGDMDVLGTAEVAGDIAWWRNDGGNPLQWIKQTIDGSSAGAWPVYAMDMDGDGDTDILSAASFVDDLAWWENDNIVGIEDSPSQPVKFHLFQNYPNPFNSTTRIDYFLSEDADVNMKIYNTLGIEIKTLINVKTIAGFYSILWDGSDNAGRPNSSGLYFCNMRINGVSVNKKLLLIK